MLRLVDHVAAGLGVLAIGEAIADRPHAAAGTLAGLDDGDRRAHGRQVVCRGQAGKAGAYHQHARPRQI